MDGYDLASAEKNNLIFYVAMYSTCIVLKMAKPKPRDIADINVEDITDAIIDECFREVRSLYHSYGGGGYRAAKGPRMAEELKKRLERKFIQPLRVETSLANRLGAGWVCYIRPQKTQFLAQDWTENKGN